MVIGARARGGGYLWALLVGEYKIKRLMGICEARPGAYAVRAERSRRIGIVVNRYLCVSKKEPRVCAEIKNLGRVNRRIYRGREGKRAGRRCFKYLARSHYVRRKLVKGTDRAGRVDQPRLRRRRAASRK